MQNAVPEDLHEDFRILPSPGVEKAARSCPLLETDKAKGEWVECCTRRFLPIATFVAGDDDVAREALQISWIKVLEAVNVSLEGPVACPWVRVIVANTARDLVRRRVRRKEVPFDDSMGGRDATLRQEAAIVERQSLELMREIIAMLPSTFGKVVELRLEGLSNAETAEQLGISRTNVESRLHRAKKKVDEIIAARIVESKAVP